QRSLALDGSRPRRSTSKGLRQDSALAEFSNFFIFLTVTVIEWRLDELQMDGRRSTLEAFQEFQGLNLFEILLTVIEWRLDEVQIDGRRSTLEAFQEFQGLNLFEILRKQSLALFIFPTVAAIGSSKQSSSINRRWAISYYFLQYIHNTLLSNTHYI
ncbi:hypothetical protein BLOT_010145, partial [Blomia tropicalis]